MSGADPYETLSLALKLFVRGKRNKPGVGARG